MAKTASLNATNRPGSRCTEGESAPALPPGARAIPSQRIQRITADPVAPRSLRDRPRSPSTASPSSAPLRAQVTFNDVFAVVDESLFSTSPLGDAIDTFVRREVAEPFIARVKRDDPQLASHLRISSVSSRPAVTKASNLRLQSCLIPDCLSLATECPGKRMDVPKCTPCSIFSLPCGDLGLRSRRLARSRDEGAAGRSWHLAGVGDDLLLVR